MRRLIESLAHRLGMMPAAARSRTKSPIRTTTPTWPSENSTTPKGRFSSGKSDSGWTATQLIDLGSKIPAAILVALDGLEECFEVSLPKPSCPLSLNYFKEDSRSIGQSLGEDLEQVPLVVTVDEN